ncbi:MAG: methyltransferase domain-containing protein [Chitinivibrionales bacterium]|nr:methyltransferase domain-containing protein [Chitinivibrionales bacterium]
MSGSIFSSIKTILSIKIDNVVTWFPRKARRMNLKLNAYSHCSSPQETLQYARTLFDVVALKYNLVTRMLSFGRDAAWKRWMIGQLPAFDRPVIADLACGTGDLTGLARRRYPHASIIGIDLSREMLARARQRPDAGWTRFVTCDMSRIGLRGESFDLITGGYALRNAPDLEQTFAEIVRLLKADGYAAFLDFSKPPERLRAKVQLALLELWGSLWGIALHGNRHVYGYIARSLRRYPHREKVVLLARSQGLQLTASRTLFFGYIDLFIWRKVNAHA